MFVQHLMQWISEFLERRAAHMRSASTPLPDRQAVASGHLPRHTISNSPMAGSWLDDSQRLRPHPEQRAGHERPASEPAAPLPPTSVTHPLATNVPDEIATPPAPPLAAEPVPTPPQSTQPALPTAEGAASVADGAARRLIFLRYLVRHGVYNEGFGKGNLPEQYRGTTGDDALPPSDD